MFGGRFAVMRRLLLALLVRRLTRWRVIVRCAIHRVGMLNSGTWGSAGAELAPSGFFQRSGCGTAMVHGSELTAVVARRLFMRHLGGGRLDVRFAHR